MGDYLGEVMDQRPIANHPLKPLVSLDFNSGENHVQEVRREKPTCIPVIEKGDPGLVNLHRDAHALSKYGMQTRYQRRRDANLP